MNRLTNSFFLILALSSLANGQTTPTLGRVKVQQAVIRCAPGDQSPDTGKLEFGSYVTVVAKEGNDWLCIQPPAGSISWVNWALVEPQKRNSSDTLSPPFNAMISIEKGSSALLRAGKVGEDKPLSAQRTKLPHGTIVQVIGNKKKILLDGDSTETFWYPIQAPADDFRFIRKDAVEWSGTPVSTGFVVKDGNSTEKPLPGKVPEKTADGTGDFTVSIGDRPRPSGSKWDPNENPKFREAEKARGNGDSLLAEKLYQQIADEVAHKGPNQDIDLANLCYDRIFLLRQGGNGSGSETLRTPSLKNTDTTKAEAKYTVSGEGYLRATRYKIAGSAVYALVDTKGIVRHYTVSGGVDLEKHLGKWVTLSGDETKPEELRGDPLLTAKLVKTGQ